MPNVNKEMKIPLREIPTSVWFALGLLALVIIYKLAGAAHSISVLSNVVQGLERAGVGYGYMRSGIVVGIVANAVPPLIFGCGVILRRNWARIGWLIYTLFNVAALLYGQSYLDQPYPNVVKSNLALVAQIVAVYLLFTGGAPRWFDREATRSQATLP